jgi:hypothetical protein
LKAAVDSLAEAEGALLQSGIRTLKELRGLQTESQHREAEARQRLDEVAARWRELLGDENSHLIETVDDRL